MSTHNNWFDHNLEDRLKDPLATFEITIKPQDIIIPDIKLASLQTIQLLAEKNKKIFVGLSGGMDSEYVMKRFLEEGVDATPIIISAPCNKLESLFAFNFCRENNLKPIVIEKKDIEIIEMFFEEILRKINGKGVESVQALIAGRYAEDHNGIFVKSDHLLGDDDDWREPITFIGSNEWDFYNDVLIHRDNTFSFFLHTPELIGSLVKNISSDCNAQEYKHKMFGVPLRPKIKNEHTPEMKNLIYQMVRNRKFANHSSNFSSFDEFLNKLGTQHPNN
jgi:hypothetical protein